MSTTILVILLVLGAAAQVWMLIKAGAKVIQACLIVLGRYIGALAVVFVGMKIWAFAFPAVRDSVVDAWNVTWNTNKGDDPAKEVLGEAIAVVGAVVDGDVKLGTVETPRDSGSTGETTYIVVAGDSLSKIARQYSTSVEAIMQKNNLQSDVIAIGQQLKIPVP